MQKRVYGFVIYVEQKQWIPQVTIATLAKYHPPPLKQQLRYKLNALYNVYAWRLYECLRNGDVHQNQVISFSTDNNVLKGTARAKDTDLNN